MSADLLFSDKDVRDAILTSVQLQLQNEAEISKVLAFIQKPPKYTTVRINPDEKTEFITELQRELEMQYRSSSCSVPAIYEHPIITDAVIIKSVGNREGLFNPANDKVIVGLQCGISVMRGADVYAPGVMGAPLNMQAGDQVAVYADLLGKCKQGWAREFEGPAFFVGNGIAVQNRKDIFAGNKPKGIAVRMTDRIFDCPSIGDFLNSQNELSKGFLQNLPSMVCSHVLHPQPGDLVLDMCAAPGGKTTHVASLMKNQGTVIAIDKSQPKINQIMENTKKLGITNVKAFIYDSVKAVADNCSNGKLEPPFCPRTFDRILLDAPCSALGQRPQLYTKMTKKEMDSFPKLQKKLFRSAVQLLKQGGRLVYSTCSYISAENEELTAWALAEFPEIRLIPADPIVGSPGFENLGLSTEQCRMVQRFGCSYREDSAESDCIGFYIASFEKI